jgi:hypothetical protein
VTPAADGNSLPRGYHTGSTHAIRNFLAARGGEVALAEIAAAASLDRAQASRLMAQLIQRDASITRTRHGHYAHAARPATAPPARAVIGDTFECVGFAPSGEPLVRGKDDVIYHLN